MSWAVKATTTVTTSGWEGTLPPSPPLPLRQPPRQHPPHNRRQVSGDLHPAARALQTLGTSLTRPAAVATHPASWRQHPRQHPRQLLRGSHGAQERTTRPPLLRRQQLSLPELRRTARFRQPPRQGGRRTTGGTQTYPWGTTMKSPHPRKAPARVVVVSAQGGPLWPHTTWVSSLGRRRGRMPCRLTRRQPTGWVQRWALPPCRRRQTLVLPVRGGPPPPPREGAWAGGDGLARRGACLGTSWAAVQPPGHEPCWAAAGQGTSWHTRWTRTFTGRRPRQRLATAPPPRPPPRLENRGSLSQLAALRLCQLQPSHLRLARPRCRLGATLMM